MKHEITFARHPNKRDTVVECSCRFNATALNATDALRLARTHIEGERIKEAENDQSL